MKIRTLLTMTCVALVLVACKEESKPQKSHIKTAKVMTITSPITSRKRYFPGKVEASNRVNLSFQVGGRVEKFPVKEGDELKKNAVVAKLDPREFEYNLKQAESKYNLNKVEEKRFSTLHKQGHVSTSDFDKKKSSFEVAKANLQQAQKDLKDTVLVAPFNGTVIKKYVKLYQQIKPNEHIASFQDIGQVDIRVSLPENVIARMKRDSKPDLNVVFEAVPSKSFPVTVKEFSAEADPETQTFDVVLTMLAPKNINILPGMTATLLINVPIPNASHNYMVPSSAVFKDQTGKSSVWLVDPKTNTLKQQPVTIGTLAGDDLQILSGLKSGDKIVTAGVHFLQPNEKIKPMQDE
jgi:RND family efflux transporter MFP subunit